MQGLEELSWPGSRSSSGCTEGLCEGVQPLQLTSRSFRQLLGLLCMFFRRLLKLFAFPLAHATFELHYNKLVHKLSPARVFHNSWTSSVE